MAGLAALAVASPPRWPSAAGLRRSTLAPLVEAAALGSLAAGLAAGAIHALGDPAAFPDGGLPIAAVVDRGRPAAEPAGAGGPARAVPDGWRWSAWRW